MGILLNYHKILCMHFALKLITLFRREKVIVIESDLFVIATVDLVFLFQECTFEADVTIIPCMLCLKHVLIEI